MKKLPNDYLERCYAGWLGKTAGVRYGAPIEGWSYEKIAKVLGELNGYVAQYNDFAADDDTNGPAIFMRALEDYHCSEELTAEEIGKTWLNYTPYEHGMFAWGGYGRMTENTAYMNLRAGIPAPLSGSIAMNGEATAQQIGGQIFIDCWGLVNPGNPERAARLARKAASVSHDGEAINGGIFVASAVAAAFEMRDVRAIMDLALSLLPQDSEYVRMARDVYAFHDAHPDDWRACFGFVKEHYGYACYPGMCHVIPNSAVMILSMLYGENDYTRTINICNMCGWDTDCNVGNVGAIMGVMVGLEGLDYDKWLKDIHDFLPVSCVLGSLNIMDLPSLTYYTARLAYRLNGEEYPARWESILSGERAQYNFALPYATQNFRAEASTGHVWLKNDACADAAGGRALHAFVARLEPWGNRVDVFQKTYYGSQDFTDSRYDPFFSPILYPGQTFFGKVKLADNAPFAFDCRAFAYDKNHNQLIEGETVHLEPGKWTDIAVDIPAIPGGLIARAGFRFEAPTGLGSRDRLELDACITDAGYRGKADYSVDLALESVDAWKQNRRHAEITQFSRFKGYWYLQDGKMHGFADNDGETYTGDVAWRDYTLTASLTPVCGGTHQINFRVQGAIRSYALRLAEGGRLCLMKNEQGYRELAGIDYPWQSNTEYAFTIDARGDRIQVFAQDGALLLQYRDAHQPYLNGAVGFSVNNSHCAFGNITVR